MSLLADSPVNSSSSSDDFAAFLDSALDSGSPGSSSPHDENSGDKEESDKDEDQVEQVVTQVAIGSSSSESSSDEEPEEDYHLQSSSMKRARLSTSGSVGGIMDSTSRESPLYCADAEGASSSKEVCQHPGSFGGLCIACGQVYETETAVTLRYIHRGLMLGNDEISRLRNRDMKNLLRHKKLYLVLDLDHTLLNSTRLVDMTQEEEYLKGYVDSLQDTSNGSLFMFNYMQMMTKLRPFVRTFLKEASQMFEMYIYTMGDRAYALEMAKLLDPQSEYFQSRVISRDDGTERHQKGLDVVLGLDSAVIILDDTENAWMKHKDNLMLMERYHFFASSCRQFGFDCKSLSELKSDESESDGALASVLKALRKIHSLFFDEPAETLDSQDVRQVLKMVRKDVLKGCKIVFSRVFPTHFQAENHHLWKMAEQLGATCSLDLDESVTHIVAADAKTEKSIWAQKNRKYLVHPRWIESANFLWQKPCEENFTLKQTKSE